MFYKKDNIMQ